MQSSFSSFSHTHSHGPSLPRLIAVDVPLRGCSPGALWVLDRMRLPKGPPTPRGVLPGRTRPQGGGGGLQPLKRLNTSRGPWLGAPPVAYIFAELTFIRSAPPSPAHAPWGFPDQAIASCGGHPTPPPPPSGGGFQRPKQICVPKIRFKCPAPLIHLVFYRRRSFLLWVGGVVGWGWPWPLRPPPAPGL